MNCSVFLAYSGLTTAYWDGKVGRNARGVLEYGLYVIMSLADARLLNAARCRDCG
jgi:hypothetical protein